MEIHAGRIVGSLILILLASYFSLQLIVVSSERHKVVKENAEIKSVKYGLFSIHSWKEQVSEIISKKVKEFQLTSENRKELKAEIQKAMHTLLDEADRILEEKKQKANFLEQFIMELFEAAVFDIKFLRKKIPQFTEMILDGLDKYETREKLRKYIEIKIDELLYKTVGEEDLSKIVAVEAQYNCIGLSECSKIIGDKLVVYDQRLSAISLKIIVLSSVLFFIILIGNRDVLIIEFHILTLLCGILLIVGISTPMIDIDARIENFQFLLMGEKLSFEDQVLFFQSKSILGVVKVLISTKGYQSVLVGGLIFLFSVIFPILKLISTSALVQSGRLHKNKLVSFLALKSGKWSMADIFVTAIFMSYIGFKGVIENQLQQIEKVGEEIEILTTDNSNFGVGFILFLAFCIGGLMISSSLEKRLQTG